MSKLPRVWIRFKAGPDFEDVVERNPYSRATEYMPVSEAEADKGELQQEVERLRSYLSDIIACDKADSHLLAEQALAAFPSPEVKN